MRQVRIHALFTLCGLLLACGPRLYPTDPVIGQDDDEAQANRQALEQLVAGAPQQARGEESDTLPELPVTVLEPPAAPAEAGAGGPINRTELDTFLDEGPHRLLQAIQLAPVLDGRRFVGFRVEHLVPVEAVSATSGLRLGDVITAVNGRDISRPDGFMGAWDALRTADHLSVDIVREGEPQVLRWLID